MKLNNPYGNMVDKACRMLDKVDRRMMGQPETDNCGLQNCGGWFIFYDIQRE